MGYKKVEAIPYKTFKEKIKITKRYEGLYMEIEDKFIIVYF